MLEPHIVEYTHAYFPVGLFDEVNLDYLNQGYIFGRKGDSYVMMCAKSDEDAVLMFKNDMSGVTEQELAEDRDDIKTSVKELIEASGDFRYDLIFEGGNTHAWITELSSAEQDGSFESFVQRVVSNEVQFEEMTVNYVSNGAYFEVCYDEYFKLNGDVVDTEYARFESVYGIVDRKSGVMNFSFNGKTLTLNYKEGTRAE